MGSADVDCLSQRSIDKPFAQRSQALHQAAAADTGSLLEGCHACTILMDLNMRLHRPWGGTADAEDSHNSNLQTIKLMHSPAETQHSPASATSAQDLCAADV